MGRESDAMMEYLKDNERFADVFNGGLFEGHKKEIALYLKKRGLHS